MKQKLISTLVAGCMLASVGFDAHSAIGRSGGFSRPSFSRSFSAPKAPSSTPTVAPTQSKPGGIGGTTGSFGVRKSEVTQSAANKVNPPVAPAQVTPQKQYTPPPTATTPVYSQPSNVTNGSTFLSSLGGSFIGSTLSNMISGNHGSNGGTTVINNGGGSNTGAVPTPAATGTTTYVDQNGVVTSQPYQHKSYGLWDFIKDVFLFGVLIALIGGMIFVFYNGFKKLKEYWNRERGVAPTQPFNPTQMFWKIQQMHAEGSVSGLNELLGPDIIDELTNNLQPYTLMLSRVSHEVVLSNKNEFSVHYTFYEDDQRLDQVWHYELFGSDWRLNGIENI